MTASQTAKAAGLASLKELTEMSKQSTQTLTNWYNNRPELFDLVIRGAVIRKACENLVRFNTLGGAHVPVEVTARCIIVNGVRHSHNDFKAGRIDGLTMADSQRIHEAISQFYIFVGDL